MLFPMSMGLLLARSFRPVRVRGIFWFSAAVLFALFSVPFLTDGAVHWNGVFEMACIMVVFPLTGKTHEPKTINQVISTLSLFFIFIRHKFAIWNRFF